jgi:hypothetical protein
MLRYFLLVFILLDCCSAFIAQSKASNKNTNTSSATQNTVGQNSNASQPITQTANSNTSQIDGYTKAPPLGTYAQYIVTFLIGSLIALLMNRYMAAILTFIGKPFVKAKEAIYKWIAPRNPFSISLKTYRKHIRRSSLALIENLIGPALDALARFP